jgi:hypothetical protein
LEGELHLEGSVKATKLKLTWLPNIEDLVPLTLVDFGQLLLKKKLEEDDVFENFVNENSVRHPCLISRHLQFLHSCSPLPTLGAFPSSHFSDPSSPRRCQRRS